MAAARGWIFKPLIKHLECDRLVGQGADLSLYLTLSILSTGGGRSGADSRDPYILLSMLAYPVVRRIRLVDLGQISGRRGFSALAASSFILAGLRGCLVVSYVRTSSRKSGRSGFVIPSRGSTRSPAQTDICEREGSCRSPHDPKPRENCRLHHRSGMGTYCRQDRQYQSLQEPVPPLAVPSADTRVDQ